MSKTIRCHLLLAVFVLLVCNLSTTKGQTNQFTYQGNLASSGMPANGNYDFEFSLCKDLAGSPLDTRTRLGVVVTNDLFTVQLDFSPALFDGADRFLEIGVKPAGSPDPFTTLSPRQPINSVPYAFFSLNADNANSATNANQLGGVAANQYVMTDDPRMTDPRNPLPGSGQYIQNTTTQQPASNFNISGDGTAGGTLSANAVNTSTQYNIGGNRVLSIAGSTNTFVGQGAGTANTGNKNSFFGNSAGGGSNSGYANSFFGERAGAANTTGYSNSFFGRAAGVTNTTGRTNSFFGADAGRLNTTGFDNSFYGFQAGASNWVGNNNAFFGRDAGAANYGSDNSFFGAFAGSSKEWGDGNSFFGTLAGASLRGTGGSSFFGAYAGQMTTYCCNSFFGQSAGKTNTEGTYNSFFGYYAGNANTTGDDNTAIGHGADVGSGNLNHATAVGADAIVSASNTIALGRSNGSDLVRVPGILSLGTVGIAGGNNLCRNASQQIAACSSSLRYKTHVQSFVAGLDIVSRLRPITFDWRDGGMSDVGFAAEEVEKIEPLLTTRNSSGEIEGVKYAQVTTVLVNAVNEQQTQIEKQARQIEEQRKQIEALKTFVCQKDPRAALCQ